MVIRLAHVRHVHVTFERSHCIKPVSDDSACKVYHRVIAQVSAVNCENQCICCAQTMDLDNPWIAQHKVWIRTLRNNPWIAHPLRYPWIAQPHVRIKRSELEVVMVDRNIFGEEYITNSFVDREEGIKRQGEFL